MKNEYYVSGEEIFIKLPTRDYGIYWTIIDIENLAKISIIRGVWTVKPSESGNTNYVIYNKPSLLGRIYMHRLLLDLSEKDDLMPDHINRNGLDNRISNLRIVNKSINSFNKSLQSNNKSGVTRVIFRKDIGMWQAKIKLQGKNIYLGCFFHKEDAIEARSKAEDAYLP